MSHLQERDATIKQWIYEAADKIKEYMKNDLKIEEKTNPQDLVTNVDKAIEQFLVDKIHTHYPEEEIISEEGYGDSLEDLKGVVWFIDPIDGTTNFITQQENFAIMIAVYQDGVGQLGYVYDVMKDVLYSGIKGKGAYAGDRKLEIAEALPLEKGIFSSSTHLMTREKYKTIREIANETLGVRMLGSAGLEICQVVTGKSLVYMASVLSPWDIAPGQVIAKEVGILCTNFEGEPLNLLSSNQAVFSIPNVHRQIIDKINK